MNFSFYTLTFPNEAVQNNYLEFRYTIDSVEYAIRYDWVASRYGRNKISVPTSSGLTGAATAQSYFEAFQLDYASEGVFSITRNNNTVTITSLYEEVVFGDLFTDFSVTQNGTVFSGTVFTINSLELIAEDCDTITVRITTNTDMNRVTSPTTVSASGTTHDLVRTRTGLSETFTVTNDDGDTASKNIIIPEKLTSGLKIKTVNSPNGATVTIIPKVANNYTGLLNYEYSLDNSTWQSSNIFNNQAAGTYTAYLRDQYGCSTSQQFTVTSHEDFSGVTISDTVEEAFIEVPKANSLRFALQETLGNCGPYRHEDNTLSYQMDSNIPYTQKQLYNSCDSITLQFKTNYSTRTANAIVGDTSTPLTIEKKSSNIGRKDRRDATKISLEGEAGYYFDTGNIYNYATGVIEDDYSLGGKLPLWGVVGNFLYDNGWHEITEIRFDDQRNAEVLIVDLSYTGEDVFTEVKSIYNLFDYEVYEFTISFTDYESVSVEIQVEDTNYETVRYLSEDIKVEDTHDHTVFIEYWNNVNTQMVYATGIKNKLRIPVEYIRAGYEDETETNKTDDSAILVSSQQYPTRLFEFSPMTEGMMRKVHGALSSTDVYIDGIRYVKSQVETESLEETNLYIINATMIIATEEIADQFALTMSAESSSETLLRAGSGFVQL